jgi:hypothetical protein
MMANPYHYGTPVSGEQFAGREAELRAITSRMRDGINLVLLSPRRYGKTSLLGKATQTMESSGAAVVSVNVLRCRDLPVFASHLLTATYRARGARWHRVRQAIPEFLSRFRVAPQVTFDGDAPKFSFSASLSVTDADAVISDVYATLSSLSARKPSVLVLDEFQALPDLGAHLPRLLKALADEHPRVSLVLAGSKRHLMEKLVTHVDAPLYGMAEHVALDVLPDDVMVEFLIRRSTTGGKAMRPQVAERIVALAGPVPNDIQHLAYEVFDVAAKNITLDDVEAGLRLAVGHEAGLHADRFEALSAGQRRVVAQLALSPTAQPTSGQFVRLVRLSSASGVARALEALTESEVVARRGGTYCVANPFFAAWLRAEA